MKRGVLLIGVTVFLGSLPAAADEREPAKSDLSQLDARQAVREGNRQLTGGHPAEALEAYRHAEQLEPDSREIAFVEGLAHYDLKKFDQAREAFRRAAAPADDSLADDALYSLGVSDHAEALDSLDGNPKLALSLLENAMRRYHNVLAKRADHKAARDANFKAASMWRELKQQLEQQQQQQQDKNQNEENGEQERQERDEDGQQGQPQYREEQQQQQQQSDAAEQPEDKEQQQQSQAEKQEQVSREQAERRLREMMQAIRDRKKVRRQRMPTLTIAPVDKDW